MTTDEERIAAERRDRWDGRFRFRPYRIKVGRRGRRLGEQEWIAAAGCPTWGGIVPMLIQLHADGEFRTTDRVGVLDTAGWRRGQPAFWVINPHDD